MGQCNICEGLCVCMFCNFRHKVIRNVKLFSAKTMTERYAAGDMTIDIPKEVKVIVCMRR